MLGTFKSLAEVKRVVVDIETKDPLLKDKGTGWVYDSGYIVGISLKLDNEPAEYYPLKHNNESCYDIEKVKNYLHGIPKSAYVVGHYSYYDFGWLYNKLRWLHLGNYRDTLLTAQLHNNSLPSYSLDALCQYFNLGQKIKIDSKVIWTMPINTVAKYCNHDVELTAMLDDKLWKERDSEACKRECQIIPILVQMKARGIKIDLEQLDIIQKHLYDKYQNIIKLIPDIKNIWANASVATFFRRLGLVDKIINTNKGTPSFPQWYLESIEHPQIKILSEARKLHKLINTFCLGIRQHIGSDKKLHPDYFNGRSEYGGTITGRFSSANPNIQQIPGRTEDGLLVRSVFVPENGIWYRFDYKQQEPILMLHYASKLNLTGIQQWKEIYRNPEADFYKPIQEMLQIERFPAKTLTLGISYNMGYSKLARMAKISEETAKQDLYRFKHAVPWMKELKDYCQNRAIEKGSIKTIGGRYLYFNNINAQNSFNHLIQGSAADQTKQAMLDIYNELGLIPLLQIHDDLHYDFSEEMYIEKMDDQIIQQMIHVFELDFPTHIECKMGHNWKECS